MLRTWIAALLTCCIALAPVGAQQKTKSKSSSAPKGPPGTITITSFDKDHTVVGWLEIVPFESKIFHNTAHAARAGAG